MVEARLYVRDVTVTCYRRRYTLFAENTVAVVTKDVDLYQSNTMTLLFRPKFNTLRKYVLSLFSIVLIALKPSGIFSAVLSLSFCCHHKVNKDFHLQHRRHILFQYRISVEEVM